MNTLLPAMAPDSFHKIVESNFQDCGWTALKTYLTIDGACAPEALARVDPLGVRRVRVPGLLDGVTTCRAVSSFDGLCPGGRLLALLHEPFPDDLGHVVGLGTVRGMGEKMKVLAEVRHRIALPGSQIDSRE